MEIVKKQEAIKRGQVFWYDFSKNNESSIYQKCHMVVVVSNDAGNLFSSIITVCPISTQGGKLPTHIKLEKDGRKMYIHTEHIYTIPKDKLMQFKFMLPIDKIYELKYALKISLAI